MINASKSTWLPTIEQFLSLWALIDAERGENRKLTLYKNYGRAELAADYAELSTILEQHAPLAIKTAGLRATRQQLYTEIHAWMVAYNRYVKTIYNESQTRRKGVTIGPINAGFYQFSQSVRRVHANWIIHSENYAAVDGPIVVAGNVTLEVFSAKVEELNALSREMIEHKLVCRGNLSCVTELGKRKIYPRLVDFRRMVEAQYPADHSFVQSLPRLHTVKPKRSKKP